MNNSSSARMTTMHLFIQRVEREQGKKEIDIENNKRMTTELQCGKEWEKCNVED